jgi:hypothetical protein
MNYDWAMKWADALESGKYKQTAGVLKDNDGWCCLGVLCDISGRTFQKFDKAFDDDLDVYYTVAEQPKEKWDHATECTTMPPRDLCKQLDVKHDTFCFSTDDWEYAGEADCEYDLTALNDGDATFPDIAKIIRKNWEHI